MQRPRTCRRRRIRGGRGTRMRSIRLLSTRVRVFDSIIVQAYAGLVTPRTLCFVHSGSSARSAAIGVENKIQTVSSIIYHNSIIIITILFAPILLRWVCCGVCWLFSCLNLPPPPLHHMHNYAHSTIVVLFQIYHHHDRHSYYRHRRLRIYFGSRRRVRQVGFGHLSAPDSACHRLP